MKDDMRKEARREMLNLLKKEMRDELFGEMGEGLKSKKMQKVTVASDSPEGLTEGLSKAQQILKKRKEMMHQDEHMDEEEMEDEEGDEYECGGKKYEDGGYNLPEEVKRKLEALKEKAEMVTGPREDSEDMEMSEEQKKKLKEMLRR